MALRIMHDMCLAEIYKPGDMCLSSIFIHFYTCEPAWKKLWGNVVRYGRLRLFKVIEIGIPVESPYAHF